MENSLMIKVDTEVFFQISFVPFRAGEPGQSRSPAAHGPPSRGWAALRPPAQQTGLEPATQHTHGTIGPAQGRDKDMRWSISQQKLT